jgi:hypothetical protein
MVQLNSSGFLLVIAILAFAAIGSSAPACRVCSSGGEVRAVDSDGIASNIIASRVLKPSREDTIGYVSAFLTHS